MSEYLRIIRMLEQERAEVETAIQVIRKLAGLERSPELATLVAEATAEL